MLNLSWLPPIENWRLTARNISANELDRKSQLLALSASRLDFIQTNWVDAAFSKLSEAIKVEGFAGKPVRIAILGSCTLAQVHAAIRIAGIRRSIMVSIYEADYGQYWQELTDTSSALYEFKPSIILLSLDAHHLAAGINASMSSNEVDAALADVLSRIRNCWRLARDAFACLIVQQTPLPLHPEILGNNEHRLFGSKSTFIARLNASLRPMADDFGADLLALDNRMVQDGILAWHDSSLWHRAKQEISPAAAPMYGELLCRLIAAKQGRSYKCLVMDLDNTLWGGVIGDDGLEGIQLGQGSALGEAFVAFQQYARELSRRGVILAVCSKNDLANALEPFDKHPEMVLKRKDIACFVANWSDKAANIRAIADELNIGLDSLVFVDDNPFERTLVRQELPMVAVPELDDDPANFARTIADAGYFEGFSVTQEDRERTGQYQSNQMRSALKASATDLGSYLRSLEMELTWRRFDRIGLSRTVQLINKTNQFNLTTRRYTDKDVIEIIGDERAFGLQLRLTDRFGDNGIICIVIGRMQADYDLWIDTWLMSCRVLGRQVEQSTLNIIVAQAKALGACRLIGEYIPTKKNAMVRDHYAKLGFKNVQEDPGGSTRAILDLAGFEPIDTFISVREG